MKVDYLSAKELLDHFPELVEKHSITTSSLAGFYKTGMVKGEWNSKENKLFYSVRSVFKLARHINRIVIENKTVDVEALEDRWKRLG